MARGSAPPAKSRSQPNSVRDLAEKSVPVLAPLGLFTAALALWSLPDAATHGVHVVVDVRALVLISLSIIATAALAGLFEKPPKASPSEPAPPPKPPEPPPTTEAPKPEEQSVALEPAALVRSDELTGALVACHRRALCWSGKDAFDEFAASLPPRCPAAGVRGPLSQRYYRLAGDEEQRRRRSAEGLAIDQLLTSMMGTSPAIAHHVPARIVETVDSNWSSPPFAARGHVWSVRIGSSVSNMLYFCLLPHGHNERLRCSFIFAKRPGGGYKERRVHDWPAELAGQPWGPTIAGEELEQYKQADGSLLFMVHAAGLGADVDGPVDGPQRLLSAGKRERGSVSDGVGTDRSASEKMSSA